jgi:hypothetical protein
MRHDLAAVHESETVSPRVANLRHGDPERGFFAWAENGGIELRFTVGDDPSIPADD